MSESPENPPPVPDFHGNESVGATIRGRFGSQIDPRISLTSDAHPKPTQVEEDAVTKQLLQKLAIHTAAISRYDIRGEVGRGGMGVILKVWDQDLRRPLAMKVILGEGDTKGGLPTGRVDHAQLTRFLEEAQITGQLDHPGIVPVHELGVDAEGRTYFTMRLVKGRDLKTLFERKLEQRQEWPIARSLGVFVKICETMAYAHSKGVVHRDLKPANVMVGRFGETYVMDWGLAKVLDQRSSDPSPSAEDLSLVDTDRRPTHDDETKPRDQTLDGSVMGTPCFMPPEQARGQTELIGPGADVYATGAMLYQLLTGHAPYVTPGGPVAAHALLALVIHGPPPPISEMARDVDRELASICEKAMARDIADRYPDMMEMAEDIQAYLGGRVVRAHDTSSFRAFVKFLRRNRGIATAVTALIVFGIGASITFVRQQNATLRAVQAEQKLTLEARDAALVSQELAMRQTYVANLTAADVSLRANEMQAAKRRLDDCPEDLRGWEWHHLQLKTDTALAVLTHDAAVTSVALAPDGTRFATGAQDATVRLWDARTHTLLFTLEEHDDTITALAFSPDGGQLASASDDGLLRLWDVDSGKMLLTLTGHDDSVTAVAYSPDGSRIVSGSSDETLKIWDAESGQTIGTLKGHQGSLTAVAYASSGQLLVSAADDGSVCIWDAQRYALIGEPLFDRETRVFTVALSPDNKLLALGGSDKGIHVWNLAEREQVFYLSGHSAPVTALAFTFDGQELISASLDETIRIWDMQTRQPLGILRGHDDAVLSLATNTEGTLIVSSGLDRTARLWNPKVRDSFLQLDCPAYVTCVASSPDGAQLAAGSSWPRGLTLWDSASGAELLVLPCAEGDRVSAVAFGPDGTWIVTGGFEDPSLYVIDAKSGERRLGPLSEHISAVTSLAVSADGTCIVSGSDDGTARVWDANSGQQLAKLEDDGLAILSVACSADGSLIAGGSMDGTIRLWDANGTLDTLLEGHTDSVSALVFDVRGARLISGSDDETIRIWDLNGEGQGESLVLTGHTGPVVSLALGPGGREILSGSRDGTLRLWNEEFSESLLALRGHRLPVTSVAFGGDGRRVFSASFDRTVRIWETNPATRRHAAQVAASAVTKLLQELGDPRGAVEILERARQRLRADPTLDEQARGEALRILELRGGR